MRTDDIAELRLVSQKLAGQSLRTSQAIVQHFGAMQAQDYAGAKWAIAQRSAGLTTADVEASFSKGDILRLHVLRPTWHFVARDDIRWMSKLTAPGIKKASAYYLRRAGIDEALQKKVNDIIAAALQGGKQLTKIELKSKLQQAGINTVDPLRVTFFILGAEVDGVICSGKVRGKQQTYALTMERAPAAEMLPRDEALAKLAFTYFNSHGPATLKDFVWWSGLSATDAKLGLELAKTRLVRETANEQTYWLSATLAAPSDYPHVRLLPNYDEYIVAYADRTATLKKSLIKKVDSRDNILFNHTVVVDGVVRGIWKQTVRKSQTTLDVQLFNTFSAAEKAGLESAVAAYATFAQTPVAHVITQI